MNKRIISGLILSLFLLSSLLVGIASAGKGQTKQSFELELVGSAMKGTTGYYWITEDNILQARDFGFKLTSIQVKVGGEIKAVKEYSCLADLALDRSTMDGSIKIKEIITFIDGSTLEIRVSEALFDYTLPTYHTVGSFSGHGTGSLDGVQVVGISMADPTGITRTGTIMGWT
jgi:hypothetical protein